MFLQFPFQQSQRISVIDSLGSKARRRASRIVMPIKPTRAKQHHRSKQK